MIINICIILISIIYVFNTLFNLHMLQQQSYNENNSFYRFLINDIKKRYKSYLLMVSMGLLCLIVQKFKVLFLIFFIIVLIIINIDNYINYDVHNVKKPLKFTKRVIRIFALNLIFFIICECLTVNVNEGIYSGFSLLFISLNGFILIGTVYLLTPVEKLIFNYYKRKANKKLSRMNNINIIGITGSFGKTSTKMVLESILKTTYKGFYTPASFNTPNGLLITINNQNSIFNDYFIAEMGAKRAGEINELCNLVHPKYGILTSIGKAHLESFKSLDNVCKTKFELIESLPEDGIAILNKDDKFMNSYKLKNKCEVVWVSINSDADVTAHDIKISNEGTEFKIKFKDEDKDIKVKTILLGEKNIYNILQSAALAKKLGVPLKNIVKGINNIPPINHRLEIVHNNNLTIIDDSFNSNPVGAKNALDVLSMMPNQKIIITPGMIEMGEEEYNLNKEFGKQIADVCDKVYLVGKNQTKPIYDGLVSKKYNKDDIIICKSFKQAYNEVIQNVGKSKATVLFENDLPDSYMEG